MTTLQPQKDIYQELRAHCKITKLQHYNITASEKHAIKSLEHIATLQNYNITTLQPQQDMLSRAQTTLQKNNITT